MKKIIFTIVILLSLSIHQLSAQIESGKFMIGTSSLFSGIYGNSSLLTFGTTTSKTKSDNPAFESEDDDKITTFYLTPKIGYSVVNNVAAGLSITGYRQTQTSQFLGEEIKLTTSVYSAGPFVRGYLPAGNILVYAEAGAQVGSLGISLDGEGEDEKANMFSFHGEAGVAVPVGDKVNFDIGLNYLSISVKTADDNPDNTRDINSTFGLSVGINVWLGGDKGNGK